MLKCYNPIIRSKGFLLLSRINQTFQIFKILLKRQVFHLNKYSQVEGEYLYQKHRLLSKSQVFDDISPQDSKSIF